MTIGEKIVEFLKNFGIKAGLVALTLLLGIALIKLIIIIERKILKRAKIDIAVINFSLSLTKAVLWLVIVFLVGYFLGISINALIAIVSAATVAIGLALQGSLSNLASGIIIAVTKPFVDGDFVDVGMVSGKVVNIKLFTTELVTIDNKKIVIPNSTIAASNIINYTNQAERMLNMTIPVAYNSDVEKVSAVLLKIVKSNVLVLAEKEPIAKVHEYGQSSINFILRAWTKTENYWEVYWWVNSKIIEEFRKENIEIPYNKLDVFLK